jgi:hypothetical protein
MPPFSFFRNSNSSGARLCVGIVIVVGFVCGLLGSHLNYGVFNGDKRLFVLCLFVVAVLSLALLFLCRSGRRTAIFAVVFTVAWVLFLLPETQYYLDTRDAAQIFGGKIGLYEIENMIEPFDRRAEIFGYILVLLPVPFVMLGVYLRRRRLCNQSLEPIAAPRA